MIKSIPKGITREHVLLALRELDGGMPTDFGEPRKWMVVHEGRSYAPKAVIGIAAKYAFGQLLPASGFSSGEGSGKAVGYLRSLDFKVVSFVLNVEPERPARPVRLSAVATLGEAIAPQSPSLLSPQPTSAMLSPAPANSGLIRVITSCTGDKRFEPANQITLGDVQQGNDHFESREAELADYLLAAEKMYTGDGHRYLMQGIGAARNRLGDTAVECWIVSAGYGLIRGSRRIAPYNVTFKGMRKGEARAHARRLQIAEVAQDVLWSQPADLNLVLIGAAYLEALSLTPETNFVAPTLFVVSPGSRHLVRGRGNLHVVVTAERDLRRFKAGKVALKGSIGRSILQAVANRHLDCQGCLKTDLLDRLISGPGTPSGGIAVTTRLLDLQSLLAKPRGGVG